MVELWLGEDVVDTDVVAGDDDGSFVEIVTPSAEGVDDGEEFFFMSGVIEFVLIELAGLKSYWVVAGGGILGEDCADGEVGGVSGESVAGVGVGNGEDRG